MKTSIVEDYDNLFATGIDHGPPGFVRVMSEEDEEDNMRELCGMMKQFENSNDVFDRIGALFEFSVEEVVDTAFHILNKFPKDAYLQAQCVCLIRYVVCDNDVYVSDELFDKYIDTIVQSTEIVNSSLSLDDKGCKNIEEVLSGFTENCITILYKLGGKDKQNGVNLNNLVDMYKKYGKFDTQLDEMYKELF